MMTEELQAVVSADDMPADTFLKHLRHRHPKALRADIPGFASEYVEECYRTYHDQLHGLLLDGSTHEHESSHGQH